IEIADAIIKSKPDIICLQEFNHSYTRGGDADNIGLFTKKYPHYYYSMDFSRLNGFYTSGSIIFSKYPIINSGKQSFPGRYAESIIYADIIKYSDTFRIYTAHLQSFAFNIYDYADMEKIKDNNKDAMAASKNIFQKMKDAFIARGVQADIVKRELDSSPYRSVICGDFNDVPNSYTYFHIRGERQDAFLAKGLGVGKSFIALAPTLRIDYILPDNNFLIQQFDMIDENLSDHLMLIADISLKK
ncbi:MAG: endonuclease/exonuclease/phosphatase family protein, partial [Parafilimonas sp.]